MAQLLTGTLRYIALDANGNPVAGAKVYTYYPGTLTPKTTYSDEAETAANANPIVCDSSGRAVVRLASGGYRLRVTMPDGVTLLPDGDVDNVVISEAKTPAEFGAIGNGIADDTAALQAAANASYHLHMGGKEKSYKVSGAITLRSGAVIEMANATITQTATRTEIFNIAGKTDIEIFGGNFVGVSTDYNDSDSSHAVAIYGTGNEARIKVHHNRFTGFSYSALRVLAASDIEFSSNVVVGPGTPTLTPVTHGKCYGVLVDSGSTRVVISDNSISKTGQGVRVEGVTRTRIHNNVLFDITGQHGIYAGADMVELAIVGNNIYNTALQGIKVQSANAGIAGNASITITGNTITTAGDQGIFVGNGAGSAPQPDHRNSGVNVTGNTINGAGGTGINIQNTDGALVADNLIQNCAQAGINFAAVTYLRVADNVIRTCQNSGIRDETVSSFVSITGNMINNVGQVGTGSDRHGIYLQSGGVSFSVDGNRINDSNAKMQYGIYSPTIDQPTQAVTNNIVLNATDYGARFKNSTDAMSAYAGNIFTGTTGPVLNDPACPSVASASAIVLPQGDARNVKITGTTTITSIAAAGHSGAEKTLIFTGACQVTDGGNLKMAGNFTSAANATLRIACDGTDWFEAGRSTN
jgi:hypothetical protein